MASKRKRVATRQAQLSRRKRRDRAKVPHQEIAPSLAVRTGSGSSSEAGGASSTVGVNTASAAASAVVERPALPVEQRTRRNRPSRVRSEPLPSNAHLKTELIHIGILTSLMVVVLAILTVVLR